MLQPPPPQPPLTQFRRPAPLRAGDRVALVAPGGAYDPAALQRGVALLQSHGLRPVVPRRPPAHLVYAAPHAARAAELTAALGDDNVACIWAVRGGSGTGRLLVELEQTLARALARRPRWLVGFSDFTALHARVQANGCQSLHGANLTNLAEWSSDARGQLFAALGLGTAPPVQFDVELVQGAPPSAFAGPLVGGNLTVLASLAGTGTLPSFAGTVLLLEDVAEAPYRLDRCLSQLVQAGVLRGVRAVLLGQLTRCGREATVRALLADTLAPLGVPLLAGAPVGHEPSSLPVIFGATARFTRRSAGPGAQLGAMQVTVAP